MNFLLPIFILPLMQLPTRNNNHAVNLTVITMLLNTRFLAHILCQYHIIFHCSLAWRMYAAIHARIRHLVDLHAPG